MASQARGEYEGDISDEEEEIEIQGVRDPTLPEDWLVVEDDEGTFYFSPSTGITTNVRPDFPAPTTPAEYWRQVAGTTSLVCACCVTSNLTRLGV